nr:MAG TPA: GSG1-like protein [Caudoviricetes sp.]
MPGGSDLFGQFFFLTGLWYTETCREFLPF